MAAVPDLSSYVGSYKTIDDASAAIKNGTFAAANPYAVGSTNYNNYGNPGAFGTPKTYPMVQWSAGGLGNSGSQTLAQQQSRDDAARISNGAANYHGTTPLATPQMLTPPAPTNGGIGFDANNAFTGQAPQTPAPVDSYNSVRNIVGGTPNSTSTFVPPTGTPQVNTPQQMSNGWTGAPNQSTATPGMPNQFSIGKIEQGQFNPTPTPSTTAAPTTPAPTLRSDAEISAYVQQQIAASLGITQSAATQAIAQGQTAANQQLGSIQTQYDRGQSTLKDNRTLEDQQNAHVYSPYAGNDQGKLSLINYARNVTDRQSAQDLTTNQNNVNQNLTDLQNKINAGQKALVDASPAEAEKLNQSLQNDRNQLQLQLRTADRADLQLQQQQAMNDFTKQSDTFKNNLAAQGQQIQQQQLNQTQSNADRTFNANRQDAATAATGYFNPSNMNASQINQQINQNSAAYANADPATREQLHQQNVYLNGLLGKTDSTGNGDYTGGNPNGAVGYQTSVTQQQGFNQNMQTQQFAYQQARDAIKDTQYQQTFDNNVKQQGLDYALKRAQLDNQITNDQAQRAIGYMNANTSASSAAANQSLQQQKFNYDTNPNSPDNLYKTSQAARDNALAIKAGDDAKKNAIDTAYKDAVGLAQKDQLFSTYDPTKQADIIDGYYQHLKPAPAPTKTVSDTDIMSQLKAKWGK